MIALPIHHEYAEDKNEYSKRIQYLLESNTKIKFETVRTNTIKEYFMNETKIHANDTP